MIGQFGVGFIWPTYCGQVTVRTRAGGRQAGKTACLGIRRRRRYRCRHPIDRSTETTCICKRRYDLLNDWRAFIISKYSDHIALPAGLKTGRRKDGETIDPSGKITRRGPVDLPAAIRKLTTMAAQSFISMLRLQRPAGSIQQVSREYHQPAVYPV